MADFRQPAAPLGCDMLLAQRTETADGGVLFAKNSDRHHTECQHVRAFPAADRPAGTTLRCQNLVIPQAPRTHAVLGFQPFWLWGFEQGVNEHGVAIGNEAIWMNAPRSAAGLMGMDLVRLGLERGATAQAALEEIVRLLETHGQGGSARFWDPHAPNYDNSFLIADRTEAWILETCGREWVARRALGRDCLSNVPTSGTRFERASAGLAGRSGLDFARDLISPTNPHREGRIRYARSCRLLAETRHPLTPADMMAFLRDREADGGGPVLKTTEEVLCMHPPPPLAFVAFRGQTVAGMVAHIPPAGAPTVWCALATPDTSPFLPFHVDVGLPAAYALGTHAYEPRSLWWRCKRLQTAVEADWANAWPRLRERWDRFERALLATEQAGGDAAPRPEREARMRANVGKLRRQLAEAEREAGLETP